VAAFREIARTATFRGALVRLREPFIFDACSVAATAG
jgi:hypothetical protein